MRQLLQKISALALTIFCLQSNPVNGATFSVDNTNDAFFGSLRQAIDDANGTPGLDTIVFNIPGGGPMFINPLSPYSDIIDPVFIDGTTENDIQARPYTDRLIVIQGTSVTGDCFRFDVGSDGSHIKHLVINQYFSGAAIANIGSNNLLITGCYLGTDDLGTSPAFSNATGIAFLASSVHCQIGDTTAEGGNVIGGNFANGIDIRAGNDSIKIISNYIGIGADGSTPVGNSSEGILAQNCVDLQIGGSQKSMRNFIGNNGGGSTAPGILLNQVANSSVLNNFIGVDETGLFAMSNASAGIVLDNCFNISLGSPTAGNVISGNFSNGIELFNGSNNNFIQGNLVGVDSTGINPLPNGTDGIYFDGAGFNTIGGNVAGAGNTISGSSNNGIALFNGSNNNTISGNYIGTNSAGSNTLGNSLYGIQIDNSSNNLIGELNGRNYIGNNSNGGIYLIGNILGSHANEIYNNFFGLAPDSITPLPNLGSAIFFDTETDNNVIGGYGDSMNVIAYNGAAISVGPPSTGTPEDNEFNLNSIYSNGSGIFVDPTSQHGVRHPELTCIVTDSTLYGKGAANEVVYIYGDLNDQAAYFLDTAHANIDGIWSKKLDLNYLSGLGVDSLTAIQDSAGNSSELAPTLRINLEDPLIVTNIFDDGCGSLRFAMEYANSTGSQETISFNIPGAGPHIIQPMSQLPNITSSVIIDGSTQNIFEGLAADSHFVVIDGVNLPSAEIFIIDATAGSTTLNHLVIGNTVSGSAIATLAPDVTISNNYIGTDHSGIAFFGSVHGIYMQGNGIIDNNLISGNTDIGVVIDASSNVSFTNNKIGTDITGTVPLGNSGAGIDIRNNSTLIDIGSTGQGNLISSNGNSGIIVQNSDNVTFQGNFIGTDITGLQSLGNSGAGIDLQSSTRITVGGNSAGSENIISGNLSSGISLSATDSSTISNNYIGVNINGDTAIAGSGDGIYLFNASNRNIIGGSFGEGNVISGNFNGINIQDAGTINNYIIGNKIGLASNGIDSVGNFNSGVVLENGTSDNFIGGITTDSANTIAFNQNDGISLFNSGDQIKISGNSIHSNSDLGIDIDDDGNTGNDGGDIDGGPNTTLNTPNMSSAVINTGNYVIDWDYNGAAGVDLEIQFFANTIDDNNGHGEGEIYLGSQNITTDGAGSFITSGTTFPEVVGMQYISATAIDNNNNTSEFSNTIFAAILTNSAPIAVDDTVLINQGTSTNVIVLNNDTDIDNNIDVSSVNITNNLANGLALVQADGTIQIDYSSNGTFIGFDTLEYVVCDSTPLCDTAFVFVEIMDTAHCEAGVTVFNADLTGNPDSVWVSPATSRVASSCCGTNTGPPTNDRCVSFDVTIDPGTQFLSFDIASGAVPGGALDWNLDCSGSYPLGVPVIVVPGNYTLSFCKPGTNSNTYSISAFGQCDSLLVTKTIDDNSCGTFRVALLYAENHSGADTINFAISNDTIFTSSELSLANDTGTFINGSGSGLWIQPDFPINAGDDVFDISAPQTTLDGLSFNGHQRGVSSQRPNIVLNMASGVPTSMKSTVRDVEIINSGLFGLDLTFADSCVIDNCTFSQNTIIGLTLDNSYTRVINSKFGTDRTGTIAMGNQLIGIGITGSNNTIGGDITTEANVISGNDSTGIFINSSSPNSIFGNYIGTDINGTNAIPNLHGIISQFSFDLQIGDGSLAHRNIISGNTDNGIFLDNALGHMVNFNYIGTDVSGMIAIPNSGDGIFMTQDPTSDTIQNSIIANNGGSGIHLVPGNLNYFYNNSIHNNGGDGIEIFADNQSGVFAPTITQINSDSTISGSNDFGALVEVFADSENEGRLKLGEVSPTGTTFNYQLTQADLLLMASQGLDSITATQSVGGNSSEFSTSLRSCIPLPIINHSIDTVAMSTTLTIDTLESILSGYGNGPTVSILDSAKGGYVELTGLATFEYISNSGYFNLPDSLTYILSNNCGWSDTNKISLFVENSPPFEITTFTDRLQPGEVAVVNLNQLIDDINKNLKIDSVVLADTITGAGAEIRIDNPGFITVDYSVIPSADNFNEDVFFTVCDSLDECINAKLSFQITSNPPDPIVHNALSLGGDDLNDVLIIENIDEPEYEGCEIWIYNKWGFEVYHKVNYDNNEPWDGKYKGEFLPTGTYSYFLKRGFEKETSDGFIEIVRE